MKITLIAKNEDDQQIGRSHAIRVDPTLAKKLKHSRKLDPQRFQYPAAWSIWAEQYTKQGTKRKRQWAVGKVALSNMECDGVWIYSYHVTIEAAITRAKYNYRNAEKVERKALTPQDAEHYAYALSAIFYTRKRGQK
jgi:hypothetical protein